MPLVVPLVVPELVPELVDGEGLLPLLPLPPPVVTDGDGWYVGVEAGVAAGVGVGVGAGVVDGGSTEAGEGVLKSETQYLPWLSACVFSFSHFKHIPDLQTSPG